jgi:hypothetical protein
VKVGPVGAPRLMRRRHGRPAPVRRNRARVGLGPRPACRRGSLRP